MLAKKYKSKVISITNPLDGIYSMELKSLGREYKYHPGQFLHFALNKDYDGVGQWPDSRCFSMQSNPNDEFIKITFSLKGSFTNKMRQELEVGSEVWLKLPYGDLFTQSHSKENTVFIAGGTGITPFLSLFTHSSFNEYNNPNVYLGFRSLEYNIYNIELCCMDKSSINMKITYEDVDGLIDIDQIFQQNGSSSDYFISGPPQMIKEFKHALVEKSVPSSRILSDNWE